MGNIEGQRLGDSATRVIFCDGDRSHVRQYATVAQQIAALRSVSLKILYYPKGAQLLADVTSNRTDSTIIIAEAELPDQEGLEALREIRAKRSNSQIIILAKNPAYALEGYEVGAVAYLLKGATSSGQFSKAFKRALDNVIDATQQFITFSCAGYSQTIRLADIAYFVVVKKIVTVHYADGEFDFYSTLGKIENTLAQYGFIRVNRNYIVSLSKIARHDNEWLVLDSGEKIPIGRNYRKVILGALKSLEGLA